MKILFEELIPYHEYETLNRGVCTFTSLITTNNKYVFLDAHLARLLEGGHALFPEVGWANHHETIKQFLSKHFYPHHYYRLTLFGEVLLVHKKKHVVKPAEARALFGATKKSPTSLPDFLKIPSYALVEWELGLAKRQGADEVIFLNGEERVTEASTSNIFIVTKVGEFITPPTSSLVLAGVMRGKLLAFLRKKQYSVCEREISKAEFIEAQEIWLTNAVQGIRRLEKCEGQAFLGGQKYQEVCAEFGRFGENHE